MGKVANFIMLSVIIQLALIMFTGSGTTTVGTSANQTISITDYVINPTLWYKNPMLDYLNAALFAFGIGAVVVGLYFIRNEWIIYAGIGGVFLSFVAGIIDFWTYMAGQGLWGGADWIIMTLFSLPILIYFVITVLDFTRGKD